MSHKTIWRFYGSWEGCRCCLAGWLACHMAGWMTGLLTAILAGLLTYWLTDKLPQWPTDWLTDCLGVQQKAYSHIGSHVMFLPDWFFSDFFQLLNRMLDSVGSQEETTVSDDYWIFFWRTDGMLEAGSPHFSHKAQNYWKYSISPIF